jgi:hypothetical protein
MMRGITVAAALLLLVHGLIHLMGMTVYMRLGEIDGMEYRTTLLDGQWELGTGGILVYGALWGVAAVGFTAAAAGWMAGWEPWRAVLVAVALVSLVLTVLDWRNAFLGAGINVVILALVWIAPRLSAIQG